MNNAYTNFGLTGISEDQYDAFIGKKARARRKERRSKRKERKEIRFERRKLKNDDRRADTEAKRAETKIMQATMLPSTPATAAAATAAATSASISAVQNTQEQIPQEQQAGFGNSTLMIVVGVLIVGGFLFMNKNDQAKAPVAIPLPQ